MIKNFTIDTSELDYLFADNETEIELDLGSIYGDFWGENISMVSAIVGKNGTGKTSILKMIKDWDLDVLTENAQRISSTKFLKIFYSSHLTFNDDRYEDDSVINISKYSQLKHDLRGDYVGVTEMLEIHDSAFYKDLILLNKNREVASELVHLGLPHIRKYKINLLKLKEDDWNISRNLRPYFDHLNIIRDKERTSREQIKIDALGLKNVEDIKKSKEYDEASYRIRLELEVIDAVILKLKRILESTGNRYLEEGFIAEPISELKNITSFKEAFYWVIENSYFKLSEESQPIFLPFKEIEEFTDALLSIVDQQENFENWTEFYIDDEVTYDFIIKFQSFTRSFQLNFDYDDYPILRLSTDVRLSTGERSIYELFSQLYKVELAISSGDYQLRKKFKDFIFLLDEADISFHPAWKKRYIKLLVNILPLIFKNKKLQIIFTTHDPLTLSDIPSQNVIFLDKNSQGYTFISQGNKETFGANVHDLLADSFFISDSLMGDFAKEKIQDLVLFLTSEEDASAGLDKPQPIRPWDENSARQLIEIVGEPVIKQRLQSLFDIKFRISEKAVLLSKIEELHQQLNELNEKNSDR